MNIGDFVKVDFRISDPKNKQGQVGQVIKIKEIDEDNTEVVVLFVDDTTGIYDSKCLIKL